VIYIDSSVALASVLAEERKPPETLWVAAQLSSSRLLEYEVWNRAYARGIGQTHRDEIEAMLRKIDLVELSRDCLHRALRPFPVQVRTLDGLHLATMEFLQRNGEPIELASYDHRLLAAARALDISIAAL
jgi:hypothetical protein